MVKNKSDYVYKTKLRKPVNFNPAKTNFYKLVRDNFITFEKINHIKYLNDVLTIYLVGIYVIEVTLF